MRLVLGRGKQRHDFVFPTGKAIGVTPEHVDQMASLLSSRGVEIVGLGYQPVSA